MAPSGNWLDGEVYTSRTGSRDRGELRDVQPVRVHPDRHDAGTRRLHRRARAEVARVLRRDGVARIGEQPQREVERLLRPLHHDHLARRAVHPARGLDVRRDRLAERRVPAGLAVAEQIAARGAETPLHTLARAAREEVCRRHAGPKGTRGARV